MSKLKTFFPVLGLIACAGLVNCSKTDSSNPHSTPPAPTTQSTPAPSPTVAPEISNWKAVKEKTQCEALKPEDCQGVYGFTITSEGSYSTGPSASGRIVSGKLSNQELATLKADAEADIATSSLSSCDAGPHIAGMADQVGVLLNNDSSYFEYSFIGTTGQTCYRGEKSAAIALHDYVRALMEKYYPANFP